MSSRQDPLEIDAELDLLVGERTMIRIRDQRAAVVLLSIELDSDQLARALGRQSRVECQARLPGWRHAGKVRENKTMEFPIPGVDHSYEDRSEVAYAAAQEDAAEGWEPDSHFSSKDSFFERDGQQWARCTIRRWTDPEDEDSAPSPTGDRLGWLARHWGDPVSPELLPAGAATHPELEGEPHLVAVGAVFRAYRGTEEACRFVDRVMAEYRRIAREAGERADE
jgi:hypothetical protein